MRQAEARMISGKELNMDNRTVDLLPDLSKVLRQLSIFSRSVNCFLAGNSQLFSIGQLTLLYDVSNMASVTIVNVV